MDDIDSNKGKKMNQTLEEKICFLCGDTFTGKSHDEHIIPDSLLGLLGIKNSKYHYIHGGEDTYSRLKVHAHKKCNNEFGSLYEEKIINVLKNMDAFETELDQMRFKLDKEIVYSDSLHQIFTTWMTKIYYGKLWKEAYYKKEYDPKLREFIHQLITSHNVHMMRYSYKANKSFCIPSSMIYYKLSRDDEFPFDFGNLVEANTIWLKLGRHFFMCCIGDGQMTATILNKSFFPAIKANEKTLSPGQFYSTLITYILTTKLTLPFKPPMLFNIGSDQNDKVVSLLYEIIKEGNFKCDEKEFEKVYESIGTTISKYLVGINHLKDKA